jgi:predicted ribonuclease YlaK
VSEVSRGIDRVEVVFDDPNLVANARLLVPATLMVRLGLEGLVDATVRLVGLVGGASPGRKVLSLVATILAGGSHIDHANVLRAGATQVVCRSG